MLSSERDERGGDADERMQDARQVAAEQVGRESGMERPEARQRQPDEEDMTIQ
jgi:hypothetical protein